MALPVRETTHPPPTVLPPERAKALFEEEAWRIAGMSGDDFLARWDAGDFRDVEDTPEGRELAYLILLIPFGRPNP